MNSGSSSKYNTAFFVRIGVLLLLLSAVGGAFAYDRLVLIPSGQQTVAQVMETCRENSATRTEVESAAGGEAHSVEASGEFQLAHYSFSRILPNLEGPKVTVVYRGDQVVDAISGGIKDEDRRRFK